MAPFRPGHLDRLAHAAPAPDVSDHHFPLPSHSGFGRRVESGGHVLWVADDADFFILGSGGSRGSIEDGTGCEIAGFGGLAALFFLFGFLGFGLFEEFWRGRVEDLAFSAGFEGVWEVVCYCGSALGGMGAGEKRVEVGLGEKGGGC